MVFLALGLAPAGLCLAAWPALATISSWSYGRWDVILAPAEDILILSQDNGNFAVEARSERGAHIRVTGQADPCGAEDIELGPGFAIERAAWDASPTRERAARLKAVFQGWAAVADLLCPGRPHRLELRRLDAALSQFDGQLAWGTP